MLMIEIIGDVVKLFFNNYRDLALPVRWCIRPNGAILVLRTRLLLESSSAQANVLQFWWELCHPCFSGHHLRGVLFTQKYTQKQIQTAEEENLRHKSIKKEQWQLFCYIIFNILQCYTVYTIQIKLTSPVSFSFIFLALRSKSTATES